MHGRIYPYQGLVTSLLAHDPLSSLHELPYDITHTPLVAGNLSIRKAMANNIPYTAVVGNLQGVQFSQSIDYLQNP